MGDEKRYCLKDGKEIPTAMAVQVFVRSNPNGFQATNEFMCIEHGANGGNGIMFDEYERLLAERASLNGEQMIAYSKFGLKNDTNMRHLVDETDNSRTKCGRIVGRIETLALPVNCNDCRYVETSNSTAFQLTPGSY